MAVEDDELVAAHAMDSWSPEASPGAEPTFVSLLRHSDRRTAIALLSNDLRLFRATTVQANLSCEVTASRELRLLREDQHHVLLGAGFHLLVERVSVHRSAAPPPAVVPTLTFEPAADVPEDELVEVFAGVADGSADNGTRLGRAQHGRRGEALARLRAARRRTFEAPWFAVARDRAGVPVGYVQSALINERAVLAEVGVVQDERGRRLVDQLLAYGTRMLTEHGQTQIRAHTDRANSAMRRAFARAGFRATGTRDDYRWSPAPR